MDARDAAAKLLTEIDGLGRQASIDLDVAAKIANDGPGSTPVVLLAIASQLAYANAIAGASFYMANRLHIILDDEGGSE